LQKTACVTKYSLSSSSNGQYESEDRLCLGYETRSGSKSKVKTLASNGDNDRLLIRLWPAVKSLGSPIFQMLQPAF